MRSNDILLVFALQEEQQGLFDGFAQLVTGMGKINSTLALTQALVQNHQKLPRLVVNLGSAGSATWPTGQLVNCTGFVERDMDLTPIGFPRYVATQQAEPVLRNGKRVLGYPDSICGSGDSFVTDDRADANQPWQVVDMEAFALARVCQNFSVPFVCMKYITDGADGAAAQSWQERLADAATALRLALDFIVSEAEVTPCA